MNKALLAVVIISLGLSACQKIVQEPIIIPGTTTTTPGGNNGNTTTPPTQPVKKIFTT